MNSAEDLLDKLKSTIDPDLLPKITEIAKTLALAVTNNNKVGLWEHLKANTESFVFNTALAIAVVEVETRDGKSPDLFVANEVLENYKELMKATSDLIIKTISSTQLILSQQTKED